MSKKSWFIRTVELRSDNSEKAKKVFASHNFIRYYVFGFYEYGRYYKCIHCDVRCHVGLGGDNSNIHSIRFCFYFYNNNKPAHKLTCDEVIMNKALD